MEASPDRADKVLLTVLVLVGLIVSGLSVAADWLRFDDQLGFGRMQVLMLAGGIFLSLISWWFLRSTSVYARWTWLAALASLMAVGFAARIVEVTYDRFYRDEYALAINIERGFLEYARGLMGGHALQFPVHYWLSYRILGGSLTAYRSMSLIAGVALLLLTPLWLKRFWPSQRTVCLIVLLMLVLNDHALFLSRYSAFAYSNSFLLSAGLFFLFMRLAEGPLDSRAWLCISLLFLPAAFFSNVIMLVPLATGVLSVIVFRWWRFADSRNLAGLGQWIWEFRPLLIFPIIYLIRQVLYPFTALGADRRPDMAHLFLPTSGCPSTLQGMIEFVLTRTYSLFWSALAPAGAHNLPTIASVFLASYGFLAVLVLVEIARRRADQRTVFTIFFTLTTLTSVAAGGLLGVYPYGSVRYIPYLTMPCAILIGIGGSLVYRWIFEGLGLSRSWNALLAYLAVSALIAGGYLCVARYDHITTVEASDDQAIRWIRSQQSDLVLADSHIMAMLYTKAPEIYERAHRMGWGEWGGGDVVSSELADIITGAAHSQPVDSILVVLYGHGFVQTDPYKGFARKYPLWDGLLRAHFNLGASVQGSNIQGRLYTRK